MNKTLDGRADLELYSDSGHDDMVTWLLRQGANVDAHSTNFCKCEALPALTAPWTPLNVAICHSHENTVKLLLSNNPALRADDLGLNEALQIAAAEGLTSTIYHLATLPGFNPNVQDSNGRGLLHCVIRGSKSVVAIKTLLDVGADIQGACENRSPDHTPLWSALAQGDLEVAVMLLENGAKPFVHKDNDRKKVAPYRQQLRRRSRYSYTMPLLHVTLLETNTEGNNGRHGVLQRKVIRALLDFGCDINENPSSYDATLTPLNLAIRYSSSATVLLLLERGAEVNSPCWQRSALEYALSESASASLSERVAKVTALLEYGADLLDPSVIYELIIRRRSRTMLDAVADNLSLGNLTRANEIPRVLGICCMFQERRIYDSIKVHARVQPRATDEDIRYVLEQSAGSKRGCVPASSDELGPILDEMRPGLTVDGVMDQWRGVMSESVLKWLEEIKGRESSG